MDTDAPRFCGACGTPHPVGQRFCEGCGTALAAGAIAEQPAWSGHAPPTEWSPAPSPEWVSAAPPTEVGFGWSPVVEEIGGGSGSTNPTGRSTWRRLRLPLAALTVLALLAGGVLTWLWMRDRPVHEAISAATATYQDLEQQVLDAETVEDLNDAGEAAAEARDAVEDEAGGLPGRRGELPDAARVLLAGQADSLDAMVGLQDLDPATLTTWGGVSASLAGGEETLRVAVDEMAAVDEEAAAAAAPDAGTTAHVRAVVGTAAASSLSTTTDRLLVRLGDARTTADVRAVATAAADYDEVVSAAQAGFDEGSDERNEIEALGDLLGQLTALEVIDTDHLASWRTLRPDLDAAVDAVPDLRASGRAASSSTTTLVQAGQSRLASWRRDLAAARSDQRSTVRALDAYAADVRRQLARYGGLRRDLSGFVDLVESQGIPYMDAVEQLQVSIAGRTEVRDALAAASVPVGDAETLTLVGLVDRALAVITDVERDFAANSPCIYCYSFDIDSWSDLRLESGSISAQLAPATSQWEAKVSAAIRSVTSRPLPRKPTV